MQYTTNKIKTKIDCIGMIQFRKMQLNIFKSRSVYYVSYVCYFYLTSQLGVEILQGYLPIHYYPVPNSLLHTLKNYFIIF